MPEGDPNLPRRRPDDDRDRSVTCEFCRCVLSRRGEVLRKSPEAKAFLANEEAIEKLTKQIESRDTKIAELEAQIAELKRAPQPEPVGAGGGGPKRAADDWD